MRLKTQRGDIKHALIRSYYSHYNYVVMKKLFLFLWSVIALTACSKEEGVVSKGKRKVVSTLLLITVSLFVIKSQEINHGVILGGSLGFISNLQYDHSDNINGGSATFSCRGGLFIGYKLRMIYRQKPLFYDVDLVAGGRAMEYSRYLISSLLVGNSILPSGQIALYSLSATPSINYRFWKGLYAGFGISPTLYYRRAKDDRWVFDTSITPRLGYTFGKIDVALSYRWGLLNKLLDVDDFSGGRLSSLDAQLFISF